MVLVPRINLHGSRGQHAYCDLRRSPVHVTRLHPCHYTSDLRGCPHLTLCIKSCDGGIDIPGGGATQAGTWHLLPTEVFSDGQVMQATVGVVIVWTASQTPDM